MNYRHFYCIPRYSETEKCFYGKIKGDKDLGEIEAATEADFEELFHRLVDEHLEDLREKKARRRTGWLVTFFIIVILLGVMAVTCPDKQAHLTVLSDRICAATTQEMGEDEYGIGSALMILGKKVIDAGLDKQIYVDNYIIFSLGKVNDGDVEKTVSVGVFGHIFAPSTQQIREALKQDNWI